MNIDLITVRELERLLNYSADDKITFVDIELSNQQEEIKTITINYKEIK